MKARVGNRRVRHMDWPAPGKQFQESVRSHSSAEMLQGRSTAALLSCRSDARCGWRVKSDAFACLSCGWPRPCIQNGHRLLGVPRWHSRPWASPPYRVTLCASWAPGGACKMLPHPPALRQLQRRQRGSSCAPLHAAADPLVSTLPVLALVHVLLSCEQSISDRHVYFQVPLGLDFLTFLAATVLVIPTFKSAKISPVLGFLFSGLLLGQLGCARQCLLGRPSSTAPWSMNLYTRMSQPH